MFFFFVLLFFLYFDARVFDFPRFCSFFGFFSWLLLDFPPLTQNLELGFVGATNVRFHAMKSRTRRGALYGFIMVMLTGCSKNCPHEPHKHLDQAGGAWRRPRGRAADGGAALRLGISGAPPSSLSPPAGVAHDAVAPSRLAAAWTCPLRFQESPLPPYPLPTSSKAGGPLRARRSGRRRRTLSGRMPSSTADACPPSPPTASCGQATFRVQTAATHPSEAPDSARKDGCTA